MAKGRPSKANSIYKVSVHKNNGRQYAATHPFTVGEDGKRRYSYKNWGTLEDGNRFHPNSTYFYASLEEREAPFLRGGQGSRQEGSRAASLPARPSVWTSTRWKPRAATG